ncbi:MAG: polyprenyl synthetase family protein [Phycisphaerales bacterium]|nr:polyprenyl synthetase family protein [Phycisphaerales bacterium]
MGKTAPAPTDLPLADLYAPIASDLQRAVAIMDREMQSDLPFVDGLAERVRAYRGKMLRPALLLLTADAVGKVTTTHHTLAAVVEMVHVATLVHDDVLDEADVRRQHKTINTMNGNEIAVMLGDYLISHAFHLCSSLDSQYASRLIGSTTNTVCEGEMMQLHHRGCYDLCEADYFEIIRRKTAVLTAAACTLGAKFADADGKLVVALGGFGTHAGIAFQIMDDILDLVGSEQKVGKTLGRDLDLGKLTLPLIHFLSNVDSSRRAKLLDTLRHDQTTSTGDAPADSRRSVADFLRDTGSLDYARGVARRHVDQALAVLTRLPASPARASLQAMTEFIIDRER